MSDVGVMVRVRARGSQPRTGLGGQHTKPASVRGGHVARLGNSLSFSESYKLSSVDVVSVCLRAEPRWMAISWRCASVARLLRASSLSGWREASSWSPSGPDSALCQALVT